VPQPLSLAAQAILFAARERGSLEIKGVKNAYDSAERMLAVHVDLSPERLLAFRSRRDPQLTLASLDGFRELCAAGLVRHHQGREFSLSHSGMILANQLNEADLRLILDQAIELDFEGEP
jgi:hypothetical protein